MNKRIIYQNEDRAVPAVGYIDVVTSAGASGADLDYAYISIFR